MLDKQFKLFSFMLLLFMLLSYLNTNQKKMIGGKVGIYNIKSDKYTLRIRNE